MPQKSGKLNEICHKKVAYLNRLFKILSVIGQIVLNGLFKEIKAVSFFGGIGFNR